MSFNEIIKKIDCDDMNRKKLTYIIHIANMVERILKRESFQFDVDLKKIEKNQELYDIIANSLKDIQEYFKISVPDTEMIYLLEMLDTQEDS
jgi:transcriptional regulatory protein LevR